MSRPRLQLSLFDKTVESIALTEIDGQTPGMILQYYDLDAHKDRQVETCAGDLFVIVNALEDYARLLESAVEEWQLSEVHAYLYKLHAARCRKISQKYQEATGYDYDAAVEKCRKKREKEDTSDVGEDALVLVMKHGTGAKPTEAPAAAAAPVRPGTPGQPDPNQLTF